MLVSTVNKGKDIVVAVNFDLKSYKILQDPFHPDNSVDILSVQEDIVFLISSSTSISPCVYVVTEIEKDIPKWIKLAKICTQHKTTETHKYIHKTLENIKIDTVSTTEGAEGYFIRSFDPDGSLGLYENQKKPTILFIHGGPNAWTSKDIFEKQRILWILWGFNVFIVNYRGSAGYGLSFLHSISSKAYEYDFEDTVNLFSMCLDNFKDEIDESKLAICGGSHGGYLSCSIISHPDWKDKFSAACIRNPVTAMHMSFLVSDIPDWHYSIALNKYNSWSATREDIEVMYDKSPINRVENVITPTLFAIGECDLRVPKYSGMQFWKAMKSKGIETELLYYPGEGHAISSTEYGIDMLMNFTKWFIDHF